jgi:hypothetical protein
MIKGIVPGLYKRNIGKPIEWTYDFSPNKIEIYNVHKEGGELIATDLNGNNYSIENPGFYDRQRKQVNEGAIDCFDLIKINEKDYGELKTRLLETKERTSKLLQMLEENKPNSNINKNKDSWIDDKYIDYVRNKVHANSNSEH